MRLAAPWTGDVNQVCRTRFNTVQNRHYTLLIIACAWLSLESFSRSADIETPSEYQLKAAVIFNFAKFIDWPETAFEKADSPFKLGIIGETPLEEELTQLVRDKKLGNRSFLVKQVKTASEIKTCHMLFISQTERKRLQEILKAAEFGPVLTISELDRFMQSGGMIHFLMEGNKVRFEINDAAARKAGLRISSKLLSLGRRDRTETK